MSTRNEAGKGYYGAISRNIVLIFIAVSVTPLVLVSLFILDDFQSSYEKKIGNQLELLVRKHKQNIDAFLEEKLANIRFLATNSTYAELMDKAALKQRLVALHLAYDLDFVDLGVVNSDGRQVAYAGPYEFTNVDYHETTWFKNAIERPYYISDVFLGLRNTPHFIVTVKNETDGKIWLLKATIDFGAFNNIVENLRVGETGFAFILNRQGNFQTKPKSRVLHHEAYYPPEENPSMIDTDPVALKRGNNGVEIIYASTLLKNGDWMMVLQQEYRDAIKDLRGAERTSLFIIISGSFLIILTSLLLSGRLIRRIARAEAQRARAYREKEKMSQQVIETGKLASIGELAAGIAHEINNPVAIMTEEAGWIQDLLEEEDLRQSENLDEFQRSLNQIRTQGMRCKDITHKLLSFARRTDSSKKDFVINELINEVVHLSSQRAKYANVSLNANLQENLPSIKASETELQQVLLNLVNNAMDAMEKEGGRLDIRTRFDGREIAVVVADDGPGIPEANLARIFDPFFTTKPVGKGTGLGLSICYGIIKKMGGDIEVESKVGKGTSFTIRIPVKNK